MNFEQVLQKYRDISISERDKGYRFERLIQAYLKTDPYYADIFTAVWLWNEFPSRGDFGAGDKDLGIDIVVRTKAGDYWAIQCKCYQEDTLIDRPKVDTFLATSGRSFSDTFEADKRVNFAYRLWIDTTKRGLNKEARISIQNQTPQVGECGYYDLIKAAVDWQKLDEGLSGKKATGQKYEPKPHQQVAISQVHEHLKANDRGKLIMACGTGKTFTSLRIAEKENAKTDDVSQMSATDLASPASINVKNITRQYQNARCVQKDEGGNIVVITVDRSRRTPLRPFRLFVPQSKCRFCFGCGFC